MFNDGFATVPQLRVERLVCRATEFSVLSVSWALPIARRTLGWVARLDFRVFRASVGAMVVLGVLGCSFQ